MPNQRSLLPFVIGGIAVAGVASVCVCGAAVFLLMPSGRKDTVAYQGRYASQWARDLRDRDPMIAGSAELALANIGPEGIPYLLDRLRATGNADGIRRENCTHAQAAEVMDIASARFDRPDNNAAGRLVWAEFMGRFGPDFPQAKKGIPILKGELARLESLKAHTSDIDRLKIMISRIEAGRRPGN